MGHPSNRPCPICGAQPFHPCIDRQWGYPISGYHPAR